MFKKQTYAFLFCIYKILFTNKAILQMQMQCSLRTWQRRRCHLCGKQKHSTDASNKLRGFFFFLVLGKKQNKRTGWWTNWISGPFKVFKFIKDRISILRLPSCNTVRAPLTNLEPGRAIFDTREPRMKRKPNSSHLSQLFLLSQLLYLLGSTAP